MNNYFKKVEKLILSPEELKEFRRAKEFMDGELEVTLHLDKKRGGFKEVDYTEHRYSKNFHYNMSETEFKREMNRPWKRV